VVIGPGNRQLVTGIGQLATGIRQLATGIGQLATGLWQLENLPPLCTLQKKSIHGPPLPADPGRKFIVTYY
jgi:X-X-X-Leu-X-X-Gly heptad repeat protein